ncbi:MAG: hypothetical protein MJ102_01350 [Clostridia bacterium]|nr:hypothetical protein [Clostridia bacterium]
MFEIFPSNAHGSGEQSFSAVKNGIPILTCHFRIRDDEARIMSLEQEENYAELSTESEEMISFLTVRAVLSFMENCGAAFCFCPDRILSPDLAAKCRFLPYENGDLIFVFHNESKK